MGSDESGVARLLKAAGGRPSPSEAAKQAVRAAVHAEWRDAIAKRTRRRLWLAAAAAAIAVAALALWVGRDSLDARGELVAHVSRTVGTVRARDAAWRTWQVVATAQSLRAGEEMITGPDGRAALALPDGVSLRLDHDTRVAFIGADHVDVRTGAVYVDAGREPHASRGALRVETGAGVIQHVGTQYEARIVNGGMRISVREGRVNVTPEHGSTLTAGVGEQLLVSPSGAIARSSISPGDPAWGWASRTAPPFDIDGRPVSDFLSWVGRELGRSIVFATPASEAEANRAVLSGSVNGLAPAEALAAVLPTTSLRSVDRDGRIVVSLESP